MHYVFTHYVNKISLTTLSNDNDILQMDSVVSISNWSIVFSSRDNLRGGFAATLQTVPVHSMDIRRAK